ncbi:MAG TPA: fumarylacetoacetate hydrolase family protein [Ktedonobacterales bacterium]|nr:fumarylacetoacetate hydrolase family protein [Ktedonobacterales bacterium]
MATFRDRNMEQKPRLGIVSGTGDAPVERLIDLPHAAALMGSADEPHQLTDMLTLIASGPAGLARVAALAANAPAEASYMLDEIELLAPILRPRKNVFCVGRNYAEHAAESYRAKGEAAPAAAPVSPNFFTKAPTAVNGPYADIPLDAHVTSQLDWEGELAVIIGQGGRHIPRAQALAHVWGYTVANDVTARDVQNRSGMQWFLGKSLDGSCPLGPWIVTADELVDPQRLRLTTYVNGAMKQAGTTADMIFDVAAIIEALSAVLTLEPGDIIATGTPSGVGFARTPPEFLHPGDVVEVNIEGIGTIRNRVVEA